MKTIQATIQSVSRHNEHVTVKVRRSGVSVLDYRTINGARLADLPLLYPNQKVDVVRVTNNPYLLLSFVYSE